MSATQRQTEIEKYLKESAESLSLALYDKPFAELDEKRRQVAMRGAYSQLKNTVLYEPQPGECFNCGRATTLSHQIQCWHCHESTHPTGRELWLEKNNRLHPSEVLL